MESRLSVFRQETQAFKNELDDLKDTVTDQNNTIIELLNEQQNELRTLLVGVKKNIKKKKGLIKDFSSLFPIYTQSGLDHVESIIHEINMDEMVFTIRKLLFPGGLRKNLEDVLSMDVMMQYNLDGVQRKRLKDYRKLLTVMFKSHNDKSLTYSAFLSEFRHAIKLHKNKHYKLVSIHKSKLRQQSNNTVPINDDHNSSDTNSF